MVSRHGLRRHGRSPFLYVSGPPFIPASRLQSIRLVTKYTPLENKQEGLFWIAPTLWFAITYKDGVSNFERFFEIPTREVEAILGTKEVTLDRHEVTDFLDKLNRLFNRIAKSG